MPRRTTDNAPRDRGRAGEGRFAFEGLDRVMHEKARLSILASLASNAGGLLFNDLKDLCSLTDGNLSRHLTVLSEAGLVEVSSHTPGPRRQTLYRLTAAGRRRFSDYISVLEKVVTDAQADISREPRPRRSGWSTA